MVLLAEQITTLLPCWSLAPVVRALQAMRDVGQIVAVSVAAKVGDFGCFAKPRQLMSHLGLVPSERSSGGTVRRGGITKAGDAGTAGADRWCLNLPHAGQGSAASCTTASSRCRAFGPEGLAWKIHQRAAGAT